MLGPTAQHRQLLPVRFVVAKGSRLETWDEPGVSPYVFVIEDPYALLFLTRNNTQPVPVSVCHRLLAAEVAHVDAGRIALISIFATPTSRRPIITHPFSVPYVLYDGINLRWVVADDLCQFHQFEAPRAGSNSMTHSSSFGDPGAISSTNLGCAGFNWIPIALGLLDGGDGTGQGIPLAVISQQKDCCPAATLEHEHAESHGGLGSRKCSGLGSNACASTQNQQTLPMQSHAVWQYAPGRADHRRAPSERLL